MSSSADQADQHSSSAPGKILIAGEYVVLDGAKAIVMAVNRRAYGHVADERQELSPFLEAVRDQVEDTDEIERVVIDTSAFRDDEGVKLGLGSSAAATVVATALALDTADRPLIHEVAHRAHQIAQEPRGSRGSGADIAAAVHGGILIVQQQDDENAPLKFQRTFLPPGLILIPVWTGNPADTPSLVAKVRDLRAERPDEYATVAGRIAGAAARTVDAFGKTGNAERVVEALGSGGEAIEALGQAAGATLWTKAHSRIRGLVESFGATVKPTGAGGGDVALIALAEPDAEDEVRQRLQRGGIQPLDLSVDPNGVLL